MGLKLKLSLLNIMTLVGVLLFIAIVSNFFVRKFVDLKLKETQLNTLQLLSKGVRDALVLNDTLSIINRLI